MKAAVREDGEAFAIEVLGGMVDRDLFNQNKAKWAGKLACEVAVTVLTGGVGGVGGRFAKQFADMNKFLRTIDDWLSGRRNGNNGNDPDSDSDGKPGTCPAGSFSASTPVLLADRTRRPISQVRVGDLVLATDPTTGTTGARVVLATLPHVDELLTLWTSAGPIVTTEDHEYWNATDRSWQESQNLDPGDRLHEPGGANVVVKGLDWSTLHTDAAYDLTIADLHSYHVAAGSQSVLVHNCTIRDTEGLTSSFDKHAAQWFGRRVFKATDMEAWTLLIERAARSSKSFDWDSRGTPTTAHLARIDGKYFVVQFHRGGDQAGELLTAFVPNSSELGAMLRKLDK